MNETFTTERIENVQFVDGRKNRHLSSGSEAVLNTVNTPGTVVVFPAIDLKARRVMSARFSRLAQTRGLRLRQRATANGIAVWMERKA